LRGQHLSKYAAQAGGRRKGKRKGRLNPREYQARSGHKGAAAVVLLLAHKGVLRPSEWLSLIRGGDVTLVIYSNVQLPPTLQPFHFPLEHVTAWEDFTLFAVLRDMLRYVLSALSDASNATNTTVVCRHGSRVSHAQVRTQRLRVSHGLLHSQWGQHPSSWCGAACRPMEAAGYTTGNAGHRHLSQGAGTRYAHL
jgi:hypothetical protein